jgi:hypothetical protein
MVMLLIEDVVMNTNDDTNGPPIICRSHLSEDRRTDGPPVDAAQDDGEILALMPPPQQTIWPRVWPGL